MPVLAWYRLWLTVIGKGALKFLLVETACLAACGVSRKNFQSLGHYEETGGGKPLLQSADAKCCKQRPASGDVLYHEGFKRLRDTMHSAWWGQCKPIGKLPVSDQVCSPGLINENLTQTILQHATFVVGLHCLCGSLPLCYLDERGIISMPGQHFFDSALPECRETCQFLLIGLICRGLGE